MKTSILKSFILLSAMVVPFLALAQPADPSDAYVPLDGGITLLLAAGVGYGAKKLIEHRDKFYEEE
jgi:hypothetical protein